MTVEEDIADLRARVAVLEAKEGNLRARLVAVEAFCLRARAALIAFWRKHFNRTPTNEEV